MKIKFWVDVLNFLCDFSLLSRSHIAHFDTFLYITKASLIENTPIYTYLHSKSPHICLNIIEISDIISNLECSRSKSRFYRKNFEKCILYTISLTIARRIFYAPHDVVFQKVWCKGFLTSFFPRFISQKLTEISSIKFSMKKTNLIFVTRAFLNFKFFQILKKSSFFLLLQKYNFFSNFFLKCQF